MSYADELHARWAPMIDEIVDGALKGVQPPAIRAPVWLSRTRFCRNAVELAATEFDVAPHMILSRNQRREFTRPRQVVMWAMLSAGLSPTWIGKQLSRDRSCVTHAFEKVERARRQDPIVKEFTDRYAAEVAKLVQTVAPWMLGKLRVCSTPSTAPARVPQASSSFDYDHPKGALVE